MSEELFDELRLGRALRLDDGERVRIDARALAEAADAAEHARLVRWILGALALALALPAITIARVAVAVIGEPSLVADPVALAAFVAAPLADWLRALAQPATALAVLAGVATYTAFIGREQAHAHATRT